MHECTRKAVTSARSVGARKAVVRPVKSIGDFAARAACSTPDGRPPARLGGSAECQKAM